VVAVLGMQELLMEMVTLVLQTQVAVAVALLEKILVHTVQAVRAVLA
jgi:hypothetical protein